ncbi:hypothetical protein E2562_038270 [Oryza meyeriana var. granulata]|uniref:Uncharacterized protein n=1 Tax=Oryza meyeriana var. granulata TaxID=110450 RepID=A0A6G1F248_9ORYZ|nr:hypothetical protein E2562_038270 [Oryza meyeriana var. granulata]
MAHNAEASWSNRLRDGEASSDPGPRTGEAGHEAWPVPGKGDACSSPARRKKKTTPTLKRRPFAGSS